MDQKKVLVIGQGLAGTCMAFRLMMAGWQVKVADPGISFTSSKVAAGMFTPVSGKRMVPVPQIQNLIRSLNELYGMMEQFLGVRLVHRIPIYQIMATVKEQNDFMSRMDDVAFNQFIRIDPKPEAGFDAPFGAFEVNSSGWIDLPLMLEKFRNKWLEDGNLIPEAIDYAELELKRGGFAFRNQQYNAVVCCEGFSHQRNPFFEKYIDIIPCQGDVFELTLHGIQPDRIIKKGCYLVNRGNGHFRVGSTYHWNHANDDPGREGREELEQKLQQLFSGKYTIQSHLTGIRPTTANRLPVVMRHPEISRLYALNGLGTKGVLHAPLESQRLMQWMTDDQNITQAVHNSID